MLHCRVPEGLSLAEAKLLEDGVNELSIDNRFFRIASVSGRAMSRHGATEPFAPPKNVEAVIAGDRQKPGTDQLRG